MQTHAKKTASWWLAVLRQLRQIRRYVSTDTFQALLVALVVSRLDYCNAVLTGLPALSRRLQSVLNAAACLIFVLRRSDHCVGRTNQPIFHSASSLKWPYKVLHGCASSYLGLFVRLTKSSSSPQCQHHPPHPATVQPFHRLRLNLAEWRSGRTSVFDQRTFYVLRSTSS